MNRIEKHFDAEKQLASDLQLMYWQGVRDTERFLIPRMFTVGFGVATAVFVGVALLSLLRQ